MQLLGKLIQIIAYVDFSLSSLYIVSHPKTAYSCKKVRFQVKQS